MNYVTEVVEANYKVSPEANKAGRPYPRHYAYVKMPWLATTKNPDPISPHPIPAFLNQHHADRQDWVPLKPGTRVVVAPVNKSAVNPVGLAIIAFGPQNTDDIYADLRETAAYQKFSGNAGEDKWVDDDDDPVFGPNEDVGRTHEDSYGLGWRTRHPWPDDPGRLRRVDTFPGGTTTASHRLDNLEQYVETVVTGAVTYTIRVDALAGTLTISDDAGNAISLDSNTGDLAITLLGGLAADSAALGFFGAAAVAKPVVSGSKDGNTALASLMTALAALGLVTDTTT